MHGNPVGHALWPYGHLSASRLSRSQARPLEVANSLHQLQIRKLTDELVVQRIAPGDERLCVARYSGRITASQRHIVCGEILVWKLTDTSLERVQKTHMHSVTLRKAT